jgi:hypothetical protein
VVPINPRHPLIVAAAAQTAQAVTHGNFSLGLGLGVPFLEELALAAPFPIYVAAMGPRALQMTGELADGTLPASAGPRTLEEFVAPATWRCMTRSPPTRRCWRGRGCPRRLSSPRLGPLNRSTAGSTRTRTPATDLVLSPLQTARADLQWVWEVAAAF